MFYVSLVVTTRQKPIVDTQKVKKKRNLSILLQKIIKSQRKRAREEKNKRTAKQPDSNE